MNEPIGKQLDKIFNRKSLPNFIDIPIKARITNENGKYKIHFEKYGNSHMGLSFELTEEQINKIEWWY